jgi:hypothetical protein
LCVERCRGEFQNEQLQCSCYHDVEDVEIHPSYLQAQRLSCYYQGPIASIDYDTYGGFACAVKRIGIEGEALRKLTGQIESGESISHLDFALSAPDAAYFGWSRN